MTAMGEGMVGVTCSETTLGAGWSVFGVFGVGLFECVDAAGPDCGAGAPVEVPGDVAAAEPGFDAKGLGPWWTSGLAVTALPGGAAVVDKGGLEATGRGGEATVDIPLP